MLPQFVTTSLSDITSKKEGIKDEYKKNGCDRSCAGTLSIYFAGMREKTIFLDKCG